MEHSFYQVSVLDVGHNVYEFVSVGPQGNVTKLAAFTPTKNAVTFNFAFGDLLPDCGEPDDRVVTNNGDTMKVMATLARIVNWYTEEYPDRWVYFRGRTKTLNRLFRMAINMQTVETLLEYKIYAACGREVLPFRKDVDFDGIFLKRFFLN